MRAAHVGGLSEVVGDHGRVEAAALAALPAVAQVFSTRVGQATADGMRLWAKKSESLSATTETYSGLS